MLRRFHESLKTTGSNLNVSKCEGNSTQCFSCCDISQLARWDVLREINLNFKIYDIHLQANVGQCT